MSVQKLTQPDYSPQGEVYTLWDKPVECAEPVIDRVRWEREQVLSMLIQKNGQPAHDAKAEVKKEKVYIVDWDLSKIKPH